jgi:uncharacterized alkaline shock family protein YloU
MPENNKNIGELNIDDKVISDYVTQVVSEIPGVSRFFVGFTDSLQKNILGIDSGTPGIKVSNNDGSVSISIQIIAKYGYNIPQLSYDIQLGVKNTIEEFTGMKVEAVNITVEGIDRSSQA